MAISQRAAGEWAEFVDDAVVTIPAGVQAGDRMFLLASWKVYSITAEVAGWTKIAEFADGEVNVGNGTGSMKVAAWFKDHTGSESNPTIDFSSSLSGNSIGGAVIIAFQKGAGENLGLPAFATAAITNWTNSSQTVTASSNPGITAGQLVIGLAGIRDDSTTFTRPTTAIAATGITWTGNYVEYPATHLSTTTSGDMAADSGYRIASSGTASAAPTMTATISAAETGSALWIRQGFGKIAGLTADAMISVPVADVFTADAEIEEAGADTITGDFSADAVRLAEAAGDFGADATTLAIAADTASLDATVLREQAGSFSADAVIPGEAGTIEDSIIADAEVSLVGVPAWVSPANNDPITSTPVLVFTMPQATGKLWFNLQLDKADTFDGPDLRDLKTTTDQTGWEYWDGDSWEPFPADGVPGSFSGNEARYTVNPSLPSGTWYRRIRAGTTR